MKSGTLSWITAYMVARQERGFRTEHSIQPSPDEQRLPDICLVNLCAYFWQTKRGIPTYHISLLFHCNPRKR